MEQTFGGSKYVVTYSVKLNVKVLEVICLARGEVVSSFT